MATGRIQKRGLTTWAIVMYTFLYLPIFTLIVFSFNQAKTGTVWKGFTFQWYARLFHDASLVVALKNSLIIATVTTVAMHKYRFRGKIVWNSLVYTPVIIPEIVVGVSLLSFFALLRIRLGMTTITIAHIAFCISYVILAMRNIFN